MMLIRLSSGINMPMTMSDVDLTLSALPSSSTILLSLLAVFVLMAFTRATILGLRSHVSLVKQRQLQMHQQPQQRSQEKSTVQQQRPTSSWAWGLVRWDSLPALPLSLNIPAVRGSVVGSGVGVSGDSKQAWQQQRARRTGPAFEHPLPALYQTDVPASMAKMIMSRHTFRRPTQRPPPSRPATPQIRIQRRSPSIV